MIDLLIDPGQAQLIDSVVAYIRKELPFASLRPVSGQIRPWQVDWPQIGELGWLGLALPENLGGSGYGLMEQALLFREVGRHLLPLSLFSSAVAVELALRCRDEGTAKEIAGGARRVAIALPADRNFDASVPGFHLVDAHQAGWVLVLGRALQLRPKADFAILSDVRALDPTMSLQRAYLANSVPAGLESKEASLLYAASVLASSMQTGIAEATRDLAVGYAKTREQFGKPIGAFQAIKHKCADMAVNAEAACSQTLLAALSLAKSQDDAVFQSAAAAVVSNRAAVANGEETIQIHGGMGFTNDCDAHLFLKRSHLNARLLTGALSFQEQLLAKRSVPN